MSSNPVVYDAAIIQEFAQRLYSQAASIILTTTFMGVVIGALLGIGAAIAIHSQSAIVMAAIVGAILGGLVGFSRGRERAFKLKLEAQVALCQIQIEKNTNATNS